MSSGCRDLRQALVGISGRPDSAWEWAQFRALGAAALDLCLVAGGSLDAYVDMSVDAHGVWDYLAGALVCEEAGCPVVDALGRELAVLDHDARRTPVAAATPELLDTLLARRREIADVGRPVTSTTPRGTRRAYSSVGQSTALTRQESGVRVPLRPPKSSR